jgi:hypothetical protein
MNIDAIEESRQERNDFRFCASIELTMIGLRSLRAAED